MLERRDFIDPLRIAATTHGVLDPAEPAAISEPDPDAVLLRFARRAMATTFEIVLPLGTPDAYRDRRSRPRRDRSARTADDRLPRRQRGRPHQRPGGARTGAGRGRACSTCSSAAASFIARAGGRSTSRSVGSSSCGASTDARAGCRRLDERRAALDASGMRHVRLDPAAKTIAFDRVGVELNLGSVGKGHALDRTLRLLHREAAVRSALIHGGHSSVYAVGSEPGVETRAGRSGLRDPDSPDVRLGCFRLRDRGLGISATTHQFFEHEGRRSAICSIRGRRGRRRGSRSRR